nr:ABC transporter substrate-binding protein [Tissierella simiarum]
MFIIWNPRKTHCETQDKVVLQLRWNHQFQFAGYYAADWMGYYADENIEVEIRPGCTKDNQVLNATEEVLEGRADFGIGSTDILLAEDEKKGLCIISSVLQRSAITFFIDENIPFLSPVDITKLKVGRRKNDLLDIELQAMLINEGIDPSILPIGDENEKFKSEDIINDKYDVIPGYLGGIIEFYARKEGNNLKSIKPIDYGIDFYGDTLFTTRDFVLKDPELVERFRRASMKGWEYALENPHEIIERMEKEFSNPELKSEKDFMDYNRFQAEQIRELTLYPIVNLGNINVYRWEKMYNNLKKLELVDKPINMDEFVFNYEKILLNRSKIFIKRIIKILIIILLGTIIFFVINLFNKNKELKKELEENKRKEALILYQARLAAMGEMIGNIAHQWRQPLNNLNLILSNLQDSYNYGELDSEYLHSSIGRGHLLIKQMSNTIDDFRYYLNPKNKKENFYILDSVKLALSILEENIRFNNITLIVDEIDSLTAYGYKNQYSQVIYNILNNSIDALVSIKREEKIIKILIYDENHRAVCEIIDNAGGISNEIKENIFDAYFTTKNNSDGTGLGLYMAKTIINNMNGFIQWSNIKDGVSMKLVVPKGRLEDAEYEKP